MSQEEMIMKKWVCQVCGYVWEGETAPEKCPQCKVPAEMHIYPTGGHGWGFSSDKFVGKGKDKLGYARKEFETSL